MISESVGMPFFSPAVEIALAGSIAKIMPIVSVVHQHCFSPDIFWQRHEFFQRSMNPTSKHLTIVKYSFKVEHFIES